MESALLVPMRVAPASSMSSAHAAVRMPPDAFTATDGGSDARISEESLYRSLQARYQQCMRLSSGPYSFGAYPSYGYGFGFLTDPLMFEWSF